MEKENTGLLYNNSDEVESRALVASANTTFLVAEEGNITMTKTVDRENQYYFLGDQITFTITIDNNGSAAANDLFFTDTLDPIIVPENGTEYVVTTTNGTITSRTNPITVSNIDIPAGDSATIIIVGRIA